MRRRIIFEIEAEGTENIVGDITRLVMDRVDANCEFDMRQEFLPEKISKKKEIQIPAFLQKGHMSQQEKGMRESLYKMGRGVGVNG